MILDINSFGIYISPSHLRTMQPSLRITYGTSFRTRLVNYLIYQLHSISISLYAILSICKVFSVIQPLDTKENAGYEIEHHTHQKHANNENKIRDTTQQEQELIVAGSSGLNKSRYYQVISE